MNKSELIYSIWSDERELLYIDHAKEQYEVLTEEWERVMASHKVFFTSLNVALYGKERYSSPLSGELILYYNLGKKTVNTRLESLDNAYLSTTITTCWQALEKYTSVELI